MNTTVDHTALFEAAPLPNFVIKAGNDGDFVLASANEKALAWFGKTLAQVQGRPLGDFIDPEAVPHFRKALQAAAEGKKAVSFKVMPAIPVVAMLDGFLVPPAAGKDGRIEFFSILALPA